MKKTTVIGIAGGSASGKSTLAAELEAALSAYTVKNFAMDSYYKPENELPLVKTANGREYRDYNCPDSFFLDQLKNDISDAYGKCDIIIVEGLLTLWDVEIYTRCDLKVYVDCPSDIRIIRRIKRNLMWGLSLDDITDVYLDLVRHRHEEYVAPAIEKANLVIDSTMGVESGVQAIVKRLSV